MFTIPPLGRRSPSAVVVTMYGAFSLLTLASVGAQRPSPSPSVDADSVLAALKEIKAKQVQTVTREKQNVTQSISAAIADPAKAYEQASVAVEMQGLGNDGARISEWRRRRGDLLRNPAFVNALRLQLVYISLTWQRSMGVKNKDLLPSLLDYSAQITAAQDTLLSFEPLKKSLGDNVFVNYFQIGPYISAVKEWSDQPFDPDSINEKTILPTLREMKDPRVLDYWTGKVQTELARADRGNNSLAVNKFNNVRKPELLWNRAEEEETIGMHEQAVADMLSLARSHPDHPNFDKWAARLTEIVKTPHSPDVPASSAAPTTAPGASATPGFGPLATPAH